MIWPKAACVVLPALTFSCSTGDSFQCNINTNGKLFSAKLMNIDMSIRNPATAHSPCSLDLRGLTGDADVLRGNKSIAITNIDLKLLPAHGTVKPQGNSISYVPQSAYAGTDKFTAVVTGSTGDAAGITTLDVTVDVK